MKEYASDQSRMHCSKSRIVAEISYSDCTRPLATISMTGHWRILLNVSIFLPVLSAAAPTPRDEMGLDGYKWFSDPICRQRPKPESPVLQNFIS